MVSLTRDEEVFLSENFKYFLDSTPSEDILGVVKGEVLQNKKGVQETLDEIHAYMESEFFLTTASVLSKRYANFIATIPLASMTLFNKFPNMNLDNVELIRVDEKKKWLPRLHLLSKVVTQPVDQTREQWMREELDHLFKEIVRPVFLHINHLTRLSMDVMWENISVYMFRLYERQLAEWYSAEETERMKQDFYYIVRDLPGETFGTSHNPFTYFLEQPKLETGARQRKCCCLSHRLHTDSDYCKVCPKRFK
ncbi:hypothetical protein [Halobacillus sp. Marseille-Q1614]|uniref:hypothetical protein n=1 Tax=Halobacillus sp. Marseille-Q1614 TaxID=2709134 RepID=UPI00156DC049|nr:hypothetical protein [Halobacillus sp. Marseille-Q1614]